MTPEDHEFLFLLFARIYEYFGVIRETLRSRGLWSDDDEKAFASVVHADAQALSRQFLQAYQDYKKIAEQTGAATGLTEPPPGPKKP